MPDRLSPLDASFLYREDPTTVMHVGSVVICQPPSTGFSCDDLLTLVAERIAYVPRYRQRVREVPGHLGNPVWVDDESFDLTYHVRLSALPRPGSDAQLADFVARIESRRLDRGRPLWELYLVEGLEHGRFAMVTKTHQAMIDGVAAVDIAQVVFDQGPPRESGDVPPDTWRPAREPSSAELVVGALADVVRRPTVVVETLRSGAVDARATAGRIAGGVLTLLRSAARAAPVSPLGAAIGEQRRYAMVTHSLDDYRRVRAAHGGSVNDVVLATVTGALRSWLQTRGEPVAAHTSLRALVPVSVLDEDGEGEPATAGGRVLSYLVDLPVGEPRPVMRLHQVGYQMQAHHDSGRAVGAPTLAGIAGFAPPTLHSLGARVVGSISQRMFNLVVTNVPGPQVPLYAGGARVLAAYPVTPIARGQALAVAVTSYDGGIFYGLNADRDAMPDLDVLVTCLDDALAELLDTSP